MICVLNVFIRIIKKVIPILKQRGLKVRFTLTIPDVDFNEMFGDEKEYVRNLRPISSKDCPKYYNQADALFLPTLLECFTASYPEAMVMKRPILTSDLPSAKQICGDRKKDRGHQGQDAAEPQRTRRQFQRTHTTGV